MMKYTYYNDLDSYIAGGRNGVYRKVSNNTYAIRTQSPDGYKWIGIQLHGTVVFGVREDGCYCINAGGWYTQTTARRINDYLKKIGSSHYVNMRKGHMNLDGYPVHYDRAIFEQDDCQLIYSSELFPYRNEDVTDKNRQANAYN